MRVIGYLPHPIMKVTVFETSDRFPVQFEDAYHSISCKFRKGTDLSSFADLQALIDPPFFEAMATQLQQIRSQEQALWARHSSKPSGDSADLPLII